MIRFLAAAAAAIFIFAAPAVGKPGATPDAAGARLAQSFSCAGGRKYCKQMSSCAEACYYLTQCGYSGLDRDKDGIPCENVCRRRCK